MNRSFYPDNDAEAPMRIIEVELLRSFMEENFNPNKPELKDKLKLFLDIHAHSGQRGIFIYAPQTTNIEDMNKVKNFPAVIADMSPYFSFDNCKFGNEKYKKNCARLAVFRDYKLHHSYTIESSCWGYSQIHTDNTI